MSKEAGDHRSQTGGMFASLTPASFEHPEIPHIVLWLACLTTIHRMVESHGLKRLQTTTFETGLTAQSANQLDFTSLTYSFERGLQGKAI
jgi:hypothetical protein